MYKHVIVIGVDGAGAFFEQADTPCFDKIFSKGAYTFRALASNPTISAECWGSMLLGVDPKIHGLTNKIVEKTAYPTDSPFPTLFRRIREAMPDAVISSFADWKAINIGMVEDRLGVIKEHARDTLLAPMMCDFIRKHRPDFLFSQWDSVDGAGHKYGYGTAEHLERIRQIDQMIGTVYEAVCDSGMADDTLFIVIADHGGTPLVDGSAHHGGWSDAEKYVTFGAVGNTVSEGVLENMNIRDLAAIVLYALGIDSPAFDGQGWTAQLPPGLFGELTDIQYKDISHLDSAAPRRSDAQHQSQLI